MNGWQRFRLGCAGIAAVEAAICAPIFLTLLIGGCDLGAALLSKVRVESALASAAEYATLAGQNGVASATIATNAQAIASALVSPFLRSPTVTAVVNAGAPAGSKCCVGSTWTCSTTITTCADGSTPGVYMSISASYPFVALFTLDARVTGIAIAGSVTLPLS